jgi:hypothetical protein
MPNRSIQDGIVLVRGDRREGKSAPWMSLVGEKRSDHNFSSSNPTGLAPPHTLPHSLLPPQESRHDYSEQPPPKDGQPITLVPVWKKKRTILFQAHARSVIPPKPFSCGLSLEGREREMSESFLFVCYNHLGGSRIFSRLSAW